MNDSLLVRSVPRPSLAQRFFDYNPFYLLSAMCMLAGLFSLNDSLDWSPLPVQNLLYLMLILNIYEFLLIGIGVFLWRRGAVRDATTLFVLEAFFLVDAGFLNSEIFTHDFELGLLVNLMVLVLAVLKVAAVFRGLGISVLDGRLPLVLAQMVLLLGVPGVLRYVWEHNNAVLPPMTLYATWWVVALIPIVYLLLMRGESIEKHRGIISVFVALPIISIIAHLCTSNWVYNVRWYHTNLSPLMLGLAIAMGASDRHVRNLAMRMRLHLLIPAFAIALAVPERSRLNFELAGLALTPLRLTLIGATIVYLHGLLIHRHPYFGFGAGLCLGAAGLGPSPQTMSENAHELLMTAARRLWRLVPRTVSQWGLVSVAASFVLLALGLTVSLLRPRVEAVADTDDRN